MSRRDKPLAQTANRGDPWVLDAVGPPVDAADRRAHDRASTAVDPITGGVLTVDELDGPSRTSLAAVLGLAASLCALVAAALSRVWSSAWVRLWSRSARCPAGLCGRTAPPTTSRTCMPGSPDSGPGSAAGRSSRWLVSRWSGRLSATASMASVAGTPGLPFNERGNSKPGPRGAGRDGRELCTATILSLYAKPRCRAGGHVPACSGSPTRGRTGCPGPPALGSRPPAAV